VVWIVLGVVVALWAGLRDGDLVLDYAAYEELYRNGAYIVEPTFTVIALVVKNFLGDNVIFLFVIYAALAVALKWRAISTLTSLAFLSVLIYLSDTFLLHELTQIRSAVASGFMLLAIRPLYERRGWRFAGLIVMATLFHVSAFLAFFLWFLQPGRIDKTRWVAIIAGAYVMAIAGVDLFRLALYLPVPYVRDKVAMYLTLQNQLGEGINIFGLVYLGKMAVTLFLLWRADDIEPHNRYIYLLLKIMIVSEVLLLLFSSNLAAALRFSQFFGTVQILLFPLLWHTVRQKLVAWAVLTAMAALLFWVQIVRYELILPSP
jgi:hypothetical protein